MSTTIKSSIRKMKQIKYGKFDTVLDSPISTGYTTYLTDTVDPQIQDKVTVLVMAHYNITEQSFDTNYVYKPNTFLSAWVLIFDNVFGPVTIAGRYEQTGNVITFGLFTATALTPVAPFQTLEFFYQILY